MEQFFPIHISTLDNILITPKEINLNGTNALRKVKEFKLNSKQYIQYYTLIKGLKNTKMRTLLI